MNIVFYCKNVLQRLSSAIISAYIKLKYFKDDISAMGTIEVVLIVAILVALALLFKSFISGYADKIFNSIEDKTDAAFQDW